MNLRIFIKNMWVKIPTSQCIIKWPTGCDILGVVFILHDKYVCMTVTVCLKNIYLPTSKPILLTSECIEPASFTKYIAIHKNALIASLGYQMDCCYFEDVEQDSQESPHILHPQKDLQGPTDVAAAAAAEAEKVEKDQMDSFAAETSPPFGQQ